MTRWSSVDPNGFAEEHVHDSVIWDATTSSYVCSTCGVVLKGIPPQRHLHERHRPEVTNRPPDGPHNAWLNWHVMEKGSVILKKDLGKLRPCQCELFQRLYRAHLKATRSFWQDQQKSAFDRFLHRLTKYPAFQTAFPHDHPKTEKLLKTFLKCCRLYAARRGRKRLHTSTKIRIFLALIQPHLDAEIFQEIVTRMAKTTMTAVYKVRKMLGDWGTCATVNAQQKRNFIETAKHLVKEAPINPQTKKLAEDILTKRARVNGLISCKRPAILAAAALYVAISHYSPKSLSKKKIQQLMGASYIPEEIIADCQQILEMDNEGFIRSARQESLLAWLKQRSQLLETRRSFRRQLAAETVKAFPELREILKLRNVSTLKFLAQYPSTIAITQLNLDEIIAFLKTHSRGKLEDVENLAARLLMAAQKNESVGRRRPRPGNQALIRSLVKALEKVENNRLELERQMLQTIGIEGKVIMRTPGIGLITATIMILSREAPPPHHFVRQQSFLQRRLKDAIRIIQRNRQLRNQYPVLFDQKIPRVVAIQHVMDQMLQTPQLTTPHL